MFDNNQTCDSITPYWAIGLLGRRALIQADSFSVLAGASISVCSEDSYDDGYSEGHSVGYDEGHSEGYRLGYEAGYHAGKYDGRFKPNGYKGRTLGKA